MAAKATTKGQTRKRRTPASAFACPDCDFVAKHAMGLGRHRSTRHGVVSQRQARRMAGGEWLTRHEAARRGDVHYNTVRHWERQGLVRTSKRPGVRGTLINAQDLQRVLLQRSGGLALGVPATNDADVRALELRLQELIGGLERLIEQARAMSPRPAKRGPGRPKGSRNAITKATTPRAAKGVRRTGRAAAARTGSRSGLRSGAAKPARKRARSTVKRTSRARSARR